MAKKRKVPILAVTEAGNIYTTLGRRTNFIGTIEFEKPLRINGHFQGEIKSNSLLFIGETAVVKANIKSGIVILGGHVIGNIEASEKIEMLSTAKLNGNVRTPKLEIADGVVFDGNCEMIHPPGKKD